MREHRTFSTLRYTIMILLGLFLLRLSRTRSQYYIHVGEVYSLLCSYACAWRLYMLTFEVYSHNGTSANIVMHILLYTIVSLLVCCM